MAGLRLPFQLFSCRLPFTGFQFARHPLVLEPQAQCCCEAFAVAVPSAWNSLSPDLQAAHSFWALRPQLTGPLLERPSFIASSEAPFREPGAQPSHSCLHYLILSVLDTYHSLASSYLTICLLIYCLIPAEMGSLGEWKLPCSLASVSQ